jgi:Flp pilus assembly protein TadD
VRGWAAIGLRRIPASADPWIVGAFAVAARLAFILQIRKSPLAQVLVGDARQYDEWAARIASGDWLGSGVFYQAPLYPYFLGAVHLLFGRDLIAMRLVQGIVGGIACGLLVHAGRLFFDRRTGLLAGLLLAVFPPQIFFDAMIQKTVLDVGLLVLLIAGMGSIARDGASLGDRGRAGIVPLLFLGGVWGLLILTRENALALVVVLVPWIAGRGQTRANDRAVGARCAGLFLCGAILVVAPVAIRNRVVGGEFALTTSQFGVNLYLGNNAHTDGRSVPLVPGRGDARFERDDATMLASRAAGRPLGPSEVSSFWIRETFETMRNHPGRWARLTARKAGYLVNAGELVDTEGIEAYADVSPLLRRMRPLLHFGILGPLAVAGMILTWGRRRGIAPLRWMLLVLAASILPFPIFARYREPLVPLLALFAAAGLVALREIRKGGRWTIGKRTIALTLAFTIAAAILMNLPFPFASEQRAITYFAAGSALADAGRLEPAEECIREALRSQPGFVDGHKELALVESRLGRRDEAIASLRDALKIAPDDPEAANDLGVAIAEEGRLAEAESLFVIALRREPNRVEFLVNRGANLIGQGKGSRAIEPLEKAVRLDPGRISAGANLAIALASAGRFADAERELARVIALDPANPRIQALQSIIDKERPTLDTSPKKTGR